MTIPVHDIQPPEHVSQVHKPLCNQMPRVAFALPHAVAPQQPGSHQLLALLRQQVGPANDVHGAGLIFHGHKYHSLGGLRTLANRDDAAGLPKNRNKAIVIGDVAILPVLPD